VDHFNSERIHDLTQGGLYDYLEPFQHISAIPEEVPDDRDFFPELQLHPNLMPVV